MDDNAWLMLLFLLFVYGEKNPRDIPIPEIKPDDFVSEGSASIPGIAGT